MQTFVTHPNPSVTAMELDRQRLGKQRVEAIQIAQSLLGISTGWRNHPAVHMWRGYEQFLIHNYIPAIMNRWIQLGYRNDGCYSHHLILSRMVSKINIERPHWFFDDSFIRSHKSNLIRKKPEHYQDLYPGVPSYLNYVWPGGKYEN